MSMHCMCRDLIWAELPPVGGPIPLSLMYDEYTQVVICVYLHICGGCPQPCVWRECMTGALVCVCCKWMDMIQFGSWNWADLQGGMNGLRELSGPFYRWCVMNAFRNLRTRVLCTECRQMLDREISQLMYRVLREHISVNSILKTS